jgi:hypothetical protein
MNAPSFSLPPCPACSSTLAIYRPVWRLCRHTTKKTGKPTYTLVGCEHSALVSAPVKFRDEPEVWALVEDAWAEACRHMFELKTARWPQREVERFRRVLDADTALPGTIKELNLTPADPAHEQHEQTKETTHD